MQLKFGNILAGLAVRCGKPKHYCLVDNVAAAATDAREHSFSRCRYFAGKRFECLAGTPTGYAHHGDRCRRRAGGEGEDRITH